MSKDSQQLKSKKKVTLLPVLEKILTSEENSFVYSFTL